MLQAGVPGTSDLLVELLREPLSNDVTRFLSPDHPDIEDVIQETLVATLNYLSRDVEFHGDLVRLAVTIARNRCRDLMRRNQRWAQIRIEPLADWLENPQKTILEDIEESERYSILQEALEKLSPECHKLLKFTYLEEMNTEDIRQSMGLQSRQGVYYRKAGCLRRLKKLFHNLMDKRSIHVTRGARSNRERGADRG